MPGCVIGCITCPVRYDSWQLYFPWWACTESQHWFFFEGKKICQRKFRVLGVHLTSLKVQTNYSSQKVMWWPVFVVLHLYCSALDLKWKNNSSISLNTNSRCAAEQQTKLIIFFNLNSTRDLKVSKHTKCVWVNFSKMFMLVLNIFHYQHFVALTIHAGRE